MGSLIFAGGKICQVNMPAARLKPLRHPICPYLPCKDSLFLGTHTKYDLLDMSHGDYIGVYDLGY